MAGFIKAIIAFGGVRRCWHLSLFALRVRHRCNPGLLINVASHANLLVGLALLDTHTTWSRTPCALATCKSSCANDIK
eukprot:5517128-Amphidinium_carterae.1